MEEEIIKGNKLIAKYMGVEKDKNISDMMKYHSSWDWLMPVINKLLNYDHYFSSDTSSVFETWKQVVKTIKNVTSCAENEENNPKWRMVDGLKQYVLDFKEK